VTPLRKALTDIRKTWLIGKGYWQQAKLYDMITRGKRRIIVLYRQRIRFKISNLTLLMYVHKKLKLTDFVKHKIICDRCYTRLN